MTRHTNPLKIKMASNMLIERVPIIQIQKKLKKQFGKVGGGMSPNKLIQIRQDLIQSGLIKDETTIYSKSKNDTTITVPTEILYSLNQTVLQNHRKIEKIDLNFQEIYGALDMVVEQMKLFDQRMKLFELIFEQAEFLIEKTGQIEEKLDNIRFTPITTSSQSEDGNLKIEKIKKFSDLKKAAQVFLSKDARKENYKAYIFERMKVALTRFSVN